MRAPTLWSDLVTQMRWWLAHAVLGIDARDWALIPIPHEDLPGMWVREGTLAYQLAREGELLSATARAEEGRDANR